MVHFANPGLLGTEKDFHRNYQNPILRGREPDATDKDRKKGEGKGVELGQLVNQFILRRTNTLLSDHLPPKLVCVVCCSLSKVQLDMYERFLKSKFAKQLENGGKQVCDRSRAPALHCRDGRKAAQPSTSPAMHSAASHLHIADNTHTPFSSSSSFSLFPLFRHSSSRPSPASRSSATIRPLS